MSLMRQEVIESAVAVQRCLARRADIEKVAVRLRALDPSLVVVGGRGSSGHAGIFLRYVLSRDLGLVTTAAMPGVASVYKRRLRLQDALFVAISQSGRSPDLVRAAEDARESGALTLALVNDTASPLAAACELVLDIAAGPERSVAPTKSVFCSIATALALTALWADDTALAGALRRLPERMAQAVSLDWSPLVKEIARVPHLFTVGRGSGVAIAAEAALKLAKIDGIAGLAYSIAELSHGPRTLIGPDFPVVAFVQADAGRVGAVALLADLACHTTTVFAAGAAGAGIHDLPTLPTDHPDTDLLTQLVSFYLAAEDAAVLRGRDPDKPLSLHKVTRTL
jgi:glucosamine--fructose-6-phosphate aminotransferase (isomerizing)